MNINKLETNTPDSSYFDEVYVKLVEDHLTYLRNLESNRAVAITEQQNYKYEGDFYGLLSELGIAINYHYTVMRINDLDSSADYTGDLTYIIYPSLEELNVLKRSQQTIV